MHRKPHSHPIPAAPDLDSSPDSPSTADSPPNVNANMPSTSASVSTSNFPVNRISTPHTHSEALSQADGNGLHIVILGAGVTGLQTALAILERRAESNGKDGISRKITLIAHHFPGDQSPDYCSPWAGADWRSHASRSEDDGKVRAWEERTYRAWREILEQEGSAERLGDPLARVARKSRSGMAVTLSQYFTGVSYQGGDGGKIDEQGVWFQDVVGGFKNLDVEGDIDGAGFPKGKLGEGIKKGVQFEGICVDVNTYLPYLLQKVKDLGAGIIRAQIDTERGLEGAVRSVKELVRDHAVGVGVGEQDFDVDVLVNCAGLAARKFVGEEEARKLYPVRGQVVLVRGEAKTCRTLVDNLGERGDELLYVIPRPGSGTSVVGGCKQINNLDPNPDPHLTQRILSRVREVGWADEFTNEKGEIEVLGVNVGFRPMRSGGTRIEVEGARGEDGGDGGDGGGNGDKERKIDGVWVVHHYGHASGGYQRSIGCAEDVVGLIEGLE